MADPEADDTPAAFFDRVGGHDTFVRLLDDFYARVATDPPLRALYPEADLEPAKQRLLWFLEQYWGGPHTYSDTRGHPRLRMRHAPYRIDTDMRDRWLTHMLAATASLNLAEPEAREFIGYVTRAAHSLVNAFD